MNDKQGRGRVAFAGTPCDSFVGFPVPERDEELGMIPVPGYLPRQARSHRGCHPFEGFIEFRRQGLRETQRSRKRILRNAHTRIRRGKRRTRRFEQIESRLSAEEPSRRELLGYVKDYRSGRDGMLSVCDNEQGVHAVVHRRTSLRQDRIQHEKSCLIAAHAHCQPNGRQLSRGEKSRRYRLLLSSRFGMRHSFRERFGMTRKE